MSIAEDATALVKASFVTSSGLSETQLFETDCTLSEVIQLSTKMVNSIDLMEAFAKMSNSIYAKWHVRIRPAPLALDTRISRVIEDMGRQVASLVEAQNGNV